LLFVAHSPYHVAPSIRILFIDWEFQYTLAPHIWSTYAVTLHFIRYSQFMVSLVPATQVCGHEKGQSHPTLPFFVLKILYFVDYLLNFLLAPAKPTKPNPKRIKVVGSGTAVSVP